MDGFFLLKFTIEFNFFLIIMCVSGYRFSIYTTDWKVYDFPRIAFHKRTNYNHISQLISGELCFKSISSWSAVAGEDM